MQRNIVTTEDGSKTIHLVDWNEHYHSTHGAIQEANHVYIHHGLLFFSDLFPNSHPIKILEIGFGTGLNAFMTLLMAEKLNVEIEYVGVEAFPISEEERLALNYVEQLDIEKAIEFEKLHQLSWEEQHPITSQFSLTKLKKMFGDIDDKEQYNLIYFDAFGAKVQPELWTEPIFQKMYDALMSDGILVTYAAKGSVRRAMQAVGFTVEKLPGPPGKREMLRARKGA